MTLITTKNGKLSINNSTNIILSSNDIFIGQGEDVVEYVCIILTIISNTDSISSGVSIQYSSDNINWDISENFTYFSNKNTLKKISNISGRYFRIIYKNGSIDQTFFRLQTILNLTQPTDNIYVNFKESSISNFGRLLVTNKQLLSQTTQLNNKNKELIDEHIIGNGTVIHDVNTSSTILSVSNDNDKVIRQTRKYMIYQPGSTQSIKITGILNYNGLNQYNTSSKIGYFDNDNGIFFEYTNHQLYITKRSSNTGIIIDTRIIQSEWNIDKMDGNGPSKQIIDITNIQIFIFTINWLGAGNMIGGFIINDNRYFVHTFNHANITDLVSITTPNLPVRFEISMINNSDDSDSDSDSDNISSLKQMCCVIETEGGSNQIGKSISVNLGKDSKSITSQSKNSLISIRLKSNFIRTNIIIKKISIMCTTNSNFLVELYLTQAPNNPLTNDFWIDIGNYSSIEYDKQSTLFSNSDSILIQSLYINNNMNFEVSESSLNLTGNINGISDIFTIVVTNISDKTENYHCSITWQEFY